MTHRIDKVSRIARLALGGGFLVFGLNGFLHFMPNPPHPEAAGSFLGALAATGYMFPLIKGTEVLTGALLLTGRLVPLALTLLAPVLVNILAFHLFLAPEGLGLVLTLLSLELIVAWAHRDAFAPMLAHRRSGPSDGTVPDPVWTQPQPSR
jgi:hypothetical protein